MAKSKTPKGPPIPRQPMSRINYLLQASHLLHQTPVHKLSNHYLNTAKSVAKKTQIRLDPSIKRTICKRCDSLMLPGEGARYRIENKSKGGKKKWADVLVVECEACGAAKRFPVGKNEDYVLWSQRPEVLEGKKEASSTQGQGQGRGQGQAGQGQHVGGGKGKGKGNGNSATTEKGAIGKSTTQANDAKEISGTNDQEKTKTHSTVVATVESQDTEMKDAEAQVPSEPSDIKIQTTLPHY